MRVRLRSCGSRIGPGPLSVYVFNIAGNHLRIVAAVHFNRTKVYIQAIMTHAEHDTGDWKR